jgi:hypothetical protein
VAQGRKIVARDSDLAARVPEGGLIFELPPLHR